MQIGYFSKDYANKRIILDNNIVGVSLSCCNNIIQRVLNRSTTYTLGYISMFTYNHHVKGYHTINYIPITSKSWCCSFETIVPRGGYLLNINHKDKFEIHVDRRLRFLLGRMAKDNCKRLISFSKCNMVLQQKVFELCPNLYPTLMSKLIQVNVPQSLLVNKPKQELTHKKIRFIFVGRDFNRKGGCEIIRAFNQLSKHRRDFEVLLIGRPKVVHNYAFKDFQDTEIEEREIEEIIATSKEWLTIKEDIPNDQVLEYIKNSDVGLLPTWAETYGYSVLEFQAAGLPVISTNLRAMPEINPHGWRIELPLNWACELGLHNEEEKKQRRSQIVNGIIDIANYLLDNPQEIIRRGQQSYEFVKENHSYEKYAKTFKDIYGQFR